MLDDLFRNRLTQLLESACVTIDGSAPWDVRVRDPRMFRKTVLEGNLGFGESYMDGWWECYNLDELFYRILSTGIDRELVTLAKFIASIRSALINLQKPARAFTVGKRHYDAGNDLFQAMLDPLMIYSCACWHKSADLEQAQQQKLRLVFEKLGLEPGMRLLDIGCGWGGTARFAAEQYGAKVVGITVSEEQADFARAFCRDVDVEIRLMDYRQLDGTFDRIVSLGMLEHVGNRNYRAFFETARRCLHRHGRLLVQTIGSNTPAAGNDPWIEKYIFPNSLLPSASQIARAYERCFILEDWHSFGHDYSLTLKAWEKNFTRNWPQLAQHYNERFFRMWRYYLLSCSGAFRARALQLWQILFSPCGIRGKCRIPHEPAA
ncbi:MAG: cyclopropane fatty acyl phospholipid synthase [Chlorobiaceae bacterium]|nr:cyclopropane fatty acyl phospholipid synthase [Chlorobiaceae bacterium]